MIVVADADVDGICQTGGSAKGECSNEIMGYGH